MDATKFKEICDFNICEEEKEQDLENYKAVFYSQSVLDLNSPNQNNWVFTDPIREETTRIMEQREEEFNSSTEYDYSLEILISYQIYDITTNRESGIMEHRIEKISNNKEEFIENLEKICQSLKTTFTEHLVLMYNYQIFKITLTCNFFVL